MASVVRADNFGDDWSDNDERTHEIVLSDTEITEHEENIRTESTAKKSGPVWDFTEDSVSAPKEPEVNSKYRAPKLSDKVAPTNNEQNFPTFGEPVIEKPQKKGESQAAEKAEKNQSTNRYEKLEIEEETVKNEEKTAKKPGKKGKKKKSDWKKLDTEVKISLTTEKKAVEPVPQNDSSKYSQKFSSQGESRSFNIKPSGEGFRNYENKQETGAKFAVSKPETGFRTNNSKFGAGFGTNTANSSGIERRTDNVFETSEDKKSSFVWRSDNKVDQDQNKEENTEKAPKKFFNTNKTTKPETNDSLKSEVKEVKGTKTEACGESIRNEVIRKNPWGRVVS